MVLQTNVKSYSSRPFGKGYDMGPYEYPISLAGDIDMTGKIDLKDAIITLKICACRDTNNFGYRSKC